MRHTVEKLPMERSAETVNEQDEAGDTALHRAARCGHHEVLRELLGLGGDLGVPNRAGETPMSLMGNIPAEVTEEILDSCVVGKREGSEFHLTLKYPFLSPKLKETDLDSVRTDKDGSKEAMAMESPKENEDSEEIHQGRQPETTSLLFMIQSTEHKHLLEHPIVNSFLRLKFAAIAPYYVLKVFFYLVFAAFVSAYVFLVHGRNVKQESMLEESSSESAMKWIVFAMLLVMALMQLKKYFDSAKESFGNISKIAKEQRNLGSKRRAFRPLFKVMFNIEDALKLGILLTTFLVMFLPWEKEMVRHLSAITILLTWAGFLFQLAFHPYFALERYMFVTVSKNFVKVLVWYFLFVTAFALSFYFLFHMPSDAEEVNPAFASVEGSVMKTIVMVFTGELDYGGLVFTAAFGKIIFILFIFFIMLVVMNLLNGLAVSDIGIIQHESEINTQKSRMEAIIAYEGMLLNFPPSLSGGFRLIGEKLEDREAKFRLRGKNWSTDNDVWIGNVQVLDTAKALAVSKALQSTEEKQGGESGMEERLKKIEMTLEKMSEKVT